MPIALGKHRTKDRDKENVMFLLEADVAKMGHTYDRMVHTSCLPSFPSSLDVHSDLLAIAASGLLASVPWCTLRWDLGPPDPTGPTAAVTVYEHPSRWWKCDGGGMGPAQSCSPVL